MATYTTNQLTNVRADAVQIKCPYCGNEGFYTIKEKYGPFVVLCDSEDGTGCGRYFVIMVKFSAIVTTMAIADTE